MSDQLIRKLAADWYERDPRRVPRFLWKHLPRAAQEKLVLSSLRRELKWLGVTTSQFTDDELLYALRYLL